MSPSIDVALPSIEAGRQVALIRACELAQAYPVKGIIVFVASEGASTNVALPRHNERVKASLVLDAL